MYLKKNSTIKSFIYFLFFIFVTKLSEIIAINAFVTNSNTDGLQKVLFELEKISSLSKTIGNINDKLMTGLRNNATNYGLRSRIPEEYAKKGYICTSGIGWHKLYLKNLTWNEARKSCRKDNAHLAVLNTESEAQALTNLLLKNHQFSAYIGIHNQFKEDEWVTVFGDPLNETGYNRWSIGPPKILEANCGVLFEDSKLLGIPCYVERSYFCEIPGMPSC